MRRQREDSLVMMVRLFAAALAVLPSFAAVAAAPTVQETPDAITLANGLVSARFPARAHYALADYRRLPDGENLLDLCILSYTTEGATYWFQDNKSGEYGPGAVTTRIEKGADFVRLTVSGRMPPEEPGHFRMTKELHAARRRAGRSAATRWRS